MAFYACFLLHFKGIVRAMIQRWVSSALAAVMLYTSVAVPFAEANVWDERRKWSEALRKKEGAEQRLELAALPSENPGSSLSQVLRQLPRPESGALKAGISQAIREQLPSGAEEKYAELLAALPSAYGQV